MAVPIDSLGWRIILKSPTRIQGRSKSSNPPQKYKLIYKASYHIRSVNLPCPTHPFISHLQEQIHAVRSWATNRDDSTVWIESSVAQIESLQAGLEDFLRLSKTQKALTHESSTEGLLDYFLLLADVYGSFISTIVNLKQHQSEVKSAIRRGDKISLTTCLRSQRRVEKEMSQLASSLKNTTICRPLVFGPNAVQTEIVGILIEAINATSAASTAVFIGVVMMSAAASLTKTSSSLQMFKRLSTRNSSIKSIVSNEDLFVMEILEELEGCIENVEGCSERVFRSLVNLRVLLLNISTPSL
ncbi:hypothetical protein LUZ60_007072 [Juncus effusus]|nr:hypothetical protein LUZ60_007072 [Juncus effusus]